jgi:hypothetical protein
MSADGLASRRQALSSRVGHERNSQRLLAELDSRDATAAMRAYADEINARAAALEDPAAQEAHEWAGWIREHAERTDPLNGPLRIEAERATAHRGSHLVQPRRTPAAHARLEHPRAIPTLSATGLR